MFYIAHCDDSEMEHEISEEMIRWYCEETGADLKLDHYMDGSSLIEASESGKEYDIYLVDYFMPGMKGLELASELRKTGHEGLIIFVSATTEYVMDSFGVQPFYCLEKPVSPEKVRAILDAALRQLKEKRVRTMVLKTDDGERFFRVRDILYLSRFDRSAQYAVYGGYIYNTLKLRSSFQDAVSEVVGEDGFIMLGTMVVNLEQISYVSKDEIIFKDGTHFSPPAVHLRTVKTRLREYWSTPSDENRP